MAVAYDDPLKFLMAVMNNTGEDIDVRKDAAKAMLPYIHPEKRGDREKGCQKRGGEGGRWRGKIWLYGSAKTGRQ